MTFTFLLSAVLFRFAITLLDVTAFFLVIRILCEAWPMPWLQRFNHAGKPLVDGVVAVVDGTRQRLGQSQRRHVQSCLLALAGLCLLQVTVALIKER